MQTLTAYELAQALRATPDQVTELLETGAIKYFFLGDEIRIPESEVQRYIDASIKQLARENVVQTLQDGQVWGHLLSEDPDLANMVDSLDAAPGTFGDFLQQIVKKSPKGTQK